MNSHYFSDRIFEELNDAKDYIVKALEIKAMKPEWSKLFHAMSVHELEHAKTLYEMFEFYMELQKEAYGESIPCFMSADWDFVERNYSTMISEIENMQNI